MNVTVETIDHAFTTINGFESICNKDFKSPNAVYAQTVLKLNGCDLAAIAGQEGFGSAIKSGAIKVYEMIKALIKAIKDFIFGNKKDANQAATSIENNLNSIEKSNNKDDSRNISKTLINNVNSGNVSLVRTALFMEMNDKRLSTFDINQAIAFAHSKFPDLFDEYEENAYSQGIEQDKTKWDSKYYHKQELYATSNFSSKRIKHLVVIREHVFNIPQSPKGKLPVSFEDRKPLRIEIKTVIDLAVALEFNAENMLKNKEKNFNNQNETIENAIKLVNARKIDQSSEKRFLELAQKVGIDLQKLDEKLIFVDSAERLDQVCKEIKSILPDLKKISETGPSVLEQWTQALNKCNEECKGRNYYDETWKMPREDKSVIKDGIHHLTVGVKILNSIMESNTKILHHLNSQTGKWKKYLES